MGGAFRPTGFSLLDLLQSDIKDLLLCLCLAVWCIEDREFKTKRLYVMFWDMCIFLLWFVHMLLRWSFFALGSFE